MSNVGKAAHSVEKDFRPISLSSFLLKTLERLVDIDIRPMVDPKLLSEAQHAYWKGKFIETALHTVIGCLDDSMQRGEYSLAACL